MHTLKFCTFVLILVLFPLPTNAQIHKALTQIPDLKALPDRADDLQQQINQNAGCDIEGNMPDDETPTSTANILIDVTGSADDRTRSIAEIAVTSCTIQHAANYSGAEDKTVAPGGANIRLAGKACYPIDSVTISADVMSDTTVNLDIDQTHDVAVTGNTFFAPKPTNIRVKNSQRIVLSGNTFNPRQFSRLGTIEFEDCADCLITNSTIRSTTATVTSSSSAMRLADRSRSIQQR